MGKPLKILILCTGNACRSQIAQGLMKTFGGNIEVHSAGTFPGSEVNTWAIRVMAEAGIDISHHYPKPVEIYLNEEWDYVITVCADADASCPVFTGHVKHKLHFGYEDPSFLPGTDEFKMKKFRELRDEMRKELFSFYISQIKPQL